MDAVDQHQLFALLKKLEEKLDWMAQKADQISEINRKMDKIVDTTAEITSKVEKIEDSLGWCLWEIKGKK